MRKCIVCKKNSETSHGWHLCEGNLNFCSNKCVARFLERFATRQLALEKRIKKLERRHLKK